MVAVRLKTLWWVLVLYLVLGGAAFLLTRLDGPYPISKTGTVGEWMAALGAAVAVATALSLAGIEHRNQEHQRWKDEAARRVAEARRVVATLEKLWGYPGFGPELGYTLNMVAANYGSNPVRTVRLVFDWADDVADVITMAGGGDTTVVSLTPVLAPGQVSGTQPVGAFHTPEGCALTDAHLRSYGLRFIDIHGDEWIVRFGNDLGNASAHELTTPQREFWRRFPHDTALFATG